MIKRLKLVIFVIVNNLGFTDIFFYFRLNLGFTDIFFYLGGKIEFLSIGTRVLWYDYNSTIIDGTSDGPYFNTSGIEFHILRHFDGALDCVNYGCKDTVVLII